MATQFLEQELQDGYIQTSWTADTPREWKRVLVAIKELIPAEYRTWVSEYKAWTIAPQARSIYETVKAETRKSEGGALEEFDRSIDVDAALEAYNWALVKLPESMKQRAIYAILAALGEIEAEVEYSYSRGAFGAWNPTEARWVYDDGRFSQFSPTEWDSRQLAKAHKRVAGARALIQESLDRLDLPHETHEKQQLRLELLHQHDYRCYACFRRPPNLNKLHMHRVLPGRLGGTYIKENIALLCVRCHRALEGKGWDAIEAARSGNLQSLGEKEG